MEPLRTLPEVLTDILTLEGAVLEKNEEDGLEYLCSASLSKTLGIPEHGRLTFTYPAAEGSVNASYESDLFRAVERIFSSKGKMAAAVYPSQLLHMEKLSKTVSERLTLANATFRLQQAEIQALTYVLVFFKYVAISDEKKEGLFPLLINERNFSVAASLENVGEIMQGLEEPDPNLGKCPPGNSKILQTASVAALRIVEEDLGQFIKSLDRRLNRDIRRVFEYYETLKREAERSLARRALSEPDAGASPGENRVADGSGKRAGKLEAIETEKRWKIQDLISKYAMRVKIEPAAAVAIETQSSIFWIEIKRRLSSRRFPVTYNPLVRRMDPLPCEACFYPRGGYYICDEKLHIICARCFKKCPECGRPYCPACNKRGCPKCKKG